MSVSVTTQPRLRRLIRIDPVHVAVAGLAAVALALRVPWLGESFWLDEALTGYIVNSRIGDMATSITHQSEAPLYFLATSAWDRVFGFGDVTTRLVSVIAGVLTVPVAYAAARVLINRRAGVAAAALVATSPIFIFYSVEARAYALWLLLCAASLLFWAYARERDAGWAFAGWTVTAALAFATHYFAILLIVPEAVWLLARSANRRLAVRAVAGLALVGALLLPLVLYQRKHGGGDWIALNPLGDRLENARRTFTTGGPQPNRFVEIAIPVLAAAALALVVVRGEGRVRRGALIALGLTAAGMAVALLGALVGNDYILDRNLLLLWLPLAVVVAAAAGLGGRAGLAGVALVVAVCAIFVRQDFRDPSPFRRDDWRRVAQVVGRPSTRTLVVLAPLFEQPALARYSPGLNPIPKPVRATEIYTVTHFGGNPWPDPLRQATPKAPFHKIPRDVWVAPLTLVQRYRAPRPTLVSPRSLREPGRAGSVVLSWARPQR